MQYYILWISPYIQPVGYYGNIADALEYFKKDSLISSYIAHEKDESILKNIYQVVENNEQGQAYMYIYKGKNQNDTRICSADNVESAAFILNLDVNQVKRLNIGRRNYEL